MNLFATKYSCYFYVFYMMWYEALAYNNLFRGNYIEIKMHTLKLEYVAIGVNRVVFVEILMLSWLSMAMSLLSCVIWDHPTFLLF